MKKLLLYILLLINFTLAANIKCTNTTNSKVFKEYSKKDKLNELYQKNTFGGSFYDICFDLGKDYRKNYIKILRENNINCTGKWCNSGLYKCINNPRECYEVEHIVDKKNTPYDKCNTNILGNVIMAYGKWNNQVGQLCWKNVLYEKMQVYGNDIFCDAVSNIIKCGNCDIEMPMECKYINKPHIFPLFSSLVNDMLIILVIFIIVVILITGVIMGLKKYKQKKIESDIPLNNIIYL